MKRKLTTIILSFFFIVSSLIIVHTSAHAYLRELTKDQSGDLYKAYKWFCAVQNRNGLVSTREGTEGICFVYDQALAVIVYVAFDDIPRAKKVLDFFVEKHDEQILKGKFIGYADMYLSTGARGAYHFAVGPNAWLLTAINFYIQETGDKKYIPLATALSKWMMSLEGIEGGLTGGQEMDFYWMSTEHNVDAFSAFRDFSVLTGKPRYRIMAQKIHEWLKRCSWVPSEKHFINGRYDPNFATDVVTWSIASLGTMYAEGLDFVKKVALTKKYYKFKDIEVEGVDFGSTYEESPYPDKDAVWFEGTGQMAIACYVAGREEEGDFYTNELARALTDSPAHPGTMGLPYASNPGTPAYGGWQMQDEPLCVSSTAWYIYSKLKLNPFLMTGSLNVDEANVDVFATKVNISKMFYFTPVIDNFEYEIPKFITAYLANKVRSKNCVFTRVLDYNRAKSGKKSMRLLFIPHIKEKKKSKKEIDAMVASEDHTKDKDRKFISMATDSDGMKIPVSKKPKFINAQGFTSRPFMELQDWSLFTTLRFWLYTDNSSNELFIRIVDNKGNVSESKSIDLEGYGWRPQTLYLNSEDFTLVKRRGKDQSAGIDLSKVRKIMIGMRSKKPMMDSIIWVDDLRLE